VSALGCFAVDVVEIMEMSWVLVIGGGWMGDGGGVEGWSVGW